MLRLTGIILVSGAFAMAGYHKAFKIKKSIKMRKALHELIVYIKNCIETRNEALHSIFNEFNSEILSEYGFTDKLKSNKDTAFTDALECLTDLPEKLSNIYKELGANLGKSMFKSTEAEMLTRYMRLIEKEEEILIKNDEARLVLYRKLGVLAGILATLILI